MSKKLTHVGFDLDGVIADWVQGYTKYSNKRNGTPVLKTETDNIPEFSMYPWYQPKEEFVDTFMEWVKTPGAFVRIPDVSIKNTKAAYHTNRNFVTTYITARAPPISDVYDQTRAWLDRRGLTGRLFVSNNKGRLCSDLGIDYYIDDKPENLLDIEQQSPRTNPVLMRRTYQSKVVQDRFANVSSVAEYYGIVVNKNTLRK